MSSEREMHTKREIAAFEAGIKLGALYHQFVGTPVSRATAASLEQAMEKAISLQPHVSRAEVKIDREMLPENVFGYGELSGRAIYAEVEIDYEGEKIRARLEYRRDLDYPMMSLF
ncbi:MAG TPA: dihydroneopterin aldolase family protein [Methanotrichaceae archaeon]|nr:dihydroneopterin aldolase family protein [Methanotrichaceae archaeon]